MATPLPRNSGRGPPISPARAAPFVSSRTLVVQAQGQPQSSYHSDAWSNYSSSTLASSPSAAPTASLSAAINQNRSYSGYHGYSGRAGTGSSQNFMDARALVGPQMGALTTVTVTTTQGGQAADSRMGLTSAALTSPRCDSPKKGLYGMANLAAQALISETSAPPPAAGNRTRFSQAVRSLSADIEMLSPQPAQGSSREDYGTGDSEETSPLRRGLAARAAASLQSRASHRRGASVDTGSRAFSGAYERSLSAGIRGKVDDMPARSSTARPRTSASSSSALPTLSSAEVLTLDGARDVAAETGSSTVPMPPHGPPPYLSRAHPTRSVSANVSVLNNVGSPVKATGLNAEPEAEPISLTGNGSGGNSFVGREDQVDVHSPLHTLNSAIVELNDEGNLDMHVRILPSELIPWRHLQILRPISTGSFGEVFLARYKGKEVSVKRCILGQGGSMTKEQLHNLEREINTYRTLNHPNIVKYIGCVLEHPNLAVVTEYIPNGNVFDLLFMHRVNLPAAIRLKIASQVALALNYMHSCDPIVIHRDLKTQNLVLDVDYSVKFCDFGKTQPMEEDSALPLHQDNGGSPRYMAPECFQLGAYVTEKVDIWSLGCCLVEILGGPLPYEDVPQMSTVVTLILEHNQPPLVPPWFAPEVQPMLVGCFEFEPQMRIPISEVLLALRRLTPQQMELHGMDKRRTH